MRPEDPINVGVIGVGTMGRHHARVYEELPGARLVGVSDLDRERAGEIAEKYAVDVLSQDELLRRADAVSIAVPTVAHHDVTQACLKAGVGVLVEKPVVPSLAEAGDFLEMVDGYDSVVQVGHIERFNPAVSVVREMIDDLDVLSVRVDRMGPPPERTIGDNAIFDLMIHDIDILRALLEEEPDSIDAIGVDDNTHVTALFGFPGGQSARLTASRRTQRKIRRLELVARSCFVEVDFIDQWVKVHRQSVPEYVNGNGPTRFRHESVVERPQVPAGEPLRFELESFLESVQTGSEPAVTVEDGIRAIELASNVEGATTGAGSLEIRQPIDGVSL